MRAPVDDVGADRGHLRPLLGRLASSASSSCRIRRARPSGSWLGGVLFDATGGYGAAFAIACVLLAAAGLVSLHVEREPRVLRWATLTR